MTPVDFMLFVVGGTFAVAVGGALAPIIAPGVGWCVGVLLDLQSWLLGRVRA